MAGDDELEARALMIVVAGAGAHVVRRPSWPRRALAWVAQRYVGTDEGTLRESGRATASPPCRVWPSCRRQMGVEERAEEAGL